MDHEVAIKTHAVERYLLGEMPLSERDDFEEHYFTCTECAEEITSASLLIGEMKTALREIDSAPKTSSPGWLSWLKPQFLVPTFAALLLAVVVGYQNTVVMPDLEAPRSMGSAVILDGRTRGEIPTLAPGAPLRFQISTEDAAGSRLYVELTGASGAAMRKGWISAPATNRALDVFFPGALAAGRYDLIVRDRPAGKELARSTFEITR
jgi:hypothetical protein